jgi:hypothetical protein
MRIDGHPVTLSQPSMLKGRVFFSAGSSTT